jgi:N-acetylmuramoyl-L-alanine amidase
VVRLVIELKEDVRPQVFSLEPVGPYQHRLVLDLYPINPPDPLLALLREQGTSPRSSRSDPTTGEPLHAPDERVARPRHKPDPDMQRLLTVVIDPGHGGEDPGAVGRGGTYEKNVTLAIGRRLREMIAADSGLRVAMTRDGDFFVPLRTRVAKARAVQADLFVSIHADAWIKPDARGSSVFALSENGASSSAAAWMARRENDADLIGGINLASADKHLARVLLDLSTTAQINDSLKLGNSVLRELERINRLHKPRVEQAGFAVLKAPDIPSILVETAFISNPEEEARLRDDAYQEQMARALLIGIKRYFAKNPPLRRNPLT